MQIRPSNFIPSGRLKFVVGSAIVPEAAGFRYILQIVNDHGHCIGKFAEQLNKRWPSVGNNYRQWYRSSMGKLKLGTIQTIQVQSDTVIVNMVAAHGVENDEHDVPPIRYDALSKCLDEVGKEAAYNSGSIHIPRFGSIDDTGSDWDMVETLIRNLLLKRGLNVTVYDPVATD